MKIKSIIGAVLLLTVWALPGSAQIGEQRHNLAEQTGNKSNSIRRGCKKIVEENSIDISFDDEIFDGIIPKENTDTCLLYTSRRERKIRRDHGTSSSRFQNATTNADVRSCSAVSMTMKNSQTAASAMSPGDPPTSRMPIGKKKVTSELSSTVNATIPGW